MACGWSVLALPAVAHAIVSGQADDFQDGSPAGWTEGEILPSPNPPTVVFGGGPAGAGDNYLENVSAGGIGAGSRMVMFNNTQWAGDYLSAGVTRIEVDMANFGATPLSMRIAIEGGPGERYGSTAAVPLPADGLWHAVTFNLTAADLSLLGGLASLNDVLANVTELRILSAAAGPAWMGDAIAATLGADNITAKVTGDCDADGDVDLDDYFEFQGCVSGPGGGLGAGCACVDYDGDEDIDLKDFEAFQASFTG